MSYHDNALNEAWRIDGSVLVADEWVWWTADDVEDGYCANGCDKAAMVRVADIDQTDSTLTYYITNEQRDACCGTRWTETRHLRRTIPDDPSLPPELRLTSQLHSGLLSESLSIKEMKKIAAELYGLATQSKATAIPTGVCSACFGDLRFVGGAWEHLVERECTPPAVILSN